MSARYKAPNLLYKTVGLKVLLTVKIGPLVSLLKMFDKLKYRAFSSSCKTTNNSVMKRREKHISQNGRVQTLVASLASAVLYYLHLFTAKI